MLSVQLQNINNTVSLLKTLTFDTVVGLYIVYDMWYSQAMVNGMSRAFQFVKKIEMTHLEMLNIHNNVERYYIIDKYVIFLAFIHIFDQVKRTFSIDYWIIGCFCHHQNHMCCSHLAHSWWRYDCVALQRWQNGHQARPVIQPQMGPCVILFFGLHFLPRKICCFSTKKCAWLQVRILSGWWFMQRRSVFPEKLWFLLDELWSHTCTRTSHNGQVRSELSDKSRDCLFSWNEQWSRGL